MLYAIGAFTILTGLSGAMWLHSIYSVSMAEDNAAIALFGLATLAFGLIDFMMFLTWLVFK